MRTCRIWRGFLLGTGCRIGEALALTWPHVDLERHLAYVESTLIRVKGQGLLIKRPKTRSGVCLSVCCGCRCGWSRSCASGGPEIRSRRVRSSRTAWVVIATRTTSRSCIV